MSNQDTQQPQAQQEMLQKFAAQQNLTIPASELQQKLLHESNLLLGNIDTGMQNLQKQKVYALQLNEALKGAQITFQSLVEIQGYQQGVSINIIKSIASALSNKLMIKGTILAKLVWILATSSRTGKVELHCKCETDFYSSGKLNINWRDKEQREQAERDFEAELSLYVQNQQGLYSKTDAVISPAGYYYFLFPGVFLKIPIVKTSIEEAIPLIHQRAWWFNRRFLDKERTTPNPYARPYINQHGT